jgi:hypothetical protein
MALVTVTPHHSRLRDPVSAAARPVPGRLRPQRRPAARQLTRHGRRRHRRRTAAGPGCASLPASPRATPPAAAGTAPGRSGEPFRGLATRHRARALRAGRGLRRPPPGIRRRRVSPVRARRGLPRPRRRASGSCASHRRPPRSRGRVLTACSEAMSAHRPQLPHLHTPASPQWVTEDDRPGAPEWQCPEERARRAPRWSGLDSLAWPRVGSPVSPARPFTFSSQSPIGWSGPDNPADGFQPSRTHGLGWEPGRSSSIASESRSDRS